MTNAQTNEKTNATQTKLFSRPCLHVLCDVGSNMTKLQPWHLIFFPFFFFSFLVSCIVFFLTCQVRASRFYQSCFLLLWQLRVPGSQWALPDLNCKLRISVCQWALPDLNRELRGQWSLPTARSSGHCWTSTASGSQWAPPEN